MKIESNRFKRNLKTGQTQFGYWLALADAYSAEIAATAGFDWLLVDGEHGPNDLRSILQQLQSIAPYPTAPVVRPVEGTPAVIKQLLDIGAQSLMIPMVETAAQTADLVDAVRYPPEGIRGVGAAIGRASRWLAVEDYEQTVDQEICLILQIESRQGLENLDGILTVPGFDGIFIGPSDLAASMGYMGNTAHPQVQSAIRNAIEKILAAGKAAGILSTEEELIQAYREMGAGFIAVGVDTVSLAFAARELAQKYRPGS